MPQSGSVNTIALAFPEKPFNAVNNGWLAIQPLFTAHLGGNIPDMIGQTYCILNEKKDEISLIKK